MKAEKKKVLLDLSVLKHPYCGLGQIALNYLRIIRDMDTSTLPFRFVLLVPKKYFGFCGDKVDYVPRKRIFKWLPFLYPKVDVWHAIHQLSPFFPYSSQTKYLLTIHDFNFMYEKEGKVKQKYINKVQKRIDMADKIVCISKFTRTELTRWMHTADTTPVEVVYDGVEFSQPTDTAIRPIKVSEDKPFFFSIGEMKEKKNFLAIIRMMEYLPQYNLYIAGNAGTPYADECRRYIETHQLRNVTLLGFISNEERRWLYSNCEAFLFPSLFEGFGLPVIEAMSFGKPVFSSSETSLSEIGDQYAYFFKSFDAKAMAQLVEDNLPKFPTDPIRQKEQEYAFTYTYEKHFDRYIEIYSEMCNENICNEK